MKTIIAGSRDIAEPEIVRRAMQEFVGLGYTISEVVSGACRGIDTMAEAIAVQDGLPVRQFPADWEANGKAAGPIRNREMADYAEALIAVWDGESRGTKNMIEEAKKRKRVVFVLYTSGRQELFEPVLSGQGWP